MHATSFPPKPHRQVVVRVHGTPRRPVVALPALIRSTQPDELAPVDWRAQVRLATVLSVVAVIVAVGLQGIVPGAVIVLAMTGVSALVAWRRMAPLPARNSPADVLRH